MISSPSMETKQFGRLLLVFGLEDFSPGAPVHGRRIVSPSMTTSHSRDEGLAAWAATRGGSTLASGAAGLALVAGARLAAGTGIRMGTTTGTGAALLVVATARDLGSAVCPHADAKTTTTQTTQRMQRSLAQRGAAGAIHRC
jgi:hypothetical protein